MQRRPLVVGALIALVSAALILLWIQRGADAVSEASAPTTTTTSSASMPTLSRSSPAATTSPTDTTSPPASTPVVPGLLGATAEPPPAASAPAASGPTLRIPRIDLQKRLHAEGLRDGKINPPAGTVMWFTGYDRVWPGDVGTSVIAGHVVARGREDAFADLARVRVGDRIEIVDSGGVTRAFTVVRAGVLDKDRLTTDQTVWGVNTSTRRLAIVTCDDAYGFRSDGHRVANYVVIAEPA